MTLSGAVAAEVTRRTEVGAHIFPPRYLGGYVPVHGESFYAAHCPPAEAYRAAVRTDLSSWKGFLRLSVWGSLVANW